MKTWIKVLWCVLFVVSSLSFSNSSFADVGEIGVIKNPHPTKDEPYILVIDGKHFSKNQFLSYLKSKHRSNLIDADLKQVSGFEVKDLIKVIENLPTDYVMIGYTKDEPLYRIVNSMRMVESLERDEREKIKEQEKARQKLQHESKRRSEIKADIDAQKKAIIALASYLPANCCTLKYNCYQKMMTQRDSLNLIHFYNVSFDDKSALTVFPVNVTSDESSGDLSITLSKSAFDSDPELASLAITNSKTGEDTGSLLWHSADAESKRKFTIEKLPIGKMLGSDASTKTSAFPESFLSSNEKKQIAEQKVAADKYDFACYLHKVGLELGATTSSRSKRSGSSSRMH